MPGVDEATKVIDAAEKASNLGVIGILLLICLIFGGVIVYLWLRQENHHKQTIADFKELLGEQKKDSAEREKDFEEIIERVINALKENKEATEKQTEQIVVRAINAETQGRAIEFQGAAITRMEGAITNVLLSLINGGMAGVITAERFRLPPTKMAPEGKEPL